MVYRRLMAELEVFGWLQEWGDAYEYVDFRE